MKLEEGHNLVIIRVCFLQSLKKQKNRQEVYSFVIQLMIGDCEGQVYHQKKPDK